MGRRDLLDEAAIEAALREVVWTRDDYALARTVKRATFRDAIEFVNAVADIAEELDHHPDIDIRWRTVNLRVSTHSAGGLTLVDFEFARRVDALLGA